MKNFLSTAHSCVAALLFSTLLIATKVNAQWRNETNPTNSSDNVLIYLPNHVRKEFEPSLLIVLHGCDQTGSELAKHGNIDNAADRYNFTVAVPTVDDYGRWHAGCWAYHPPSQLRKEQVQHNVFRIASLTHRLAQKYKIRKSRTYITGLSSGGALSLRLGCSFPEIFAGVGAIAGPSIGSNQISAMNDSAYILESNAEDAYRNCNSLIESNPEGDDIKQQIANIAHGILDRPDDNENQDGIIRHTYCTPGLNIADLFCKNPKYPGQYRVVSKKYSRHNAYAFAKTYDAQLSPEMISIQNGNGLEQTWTTNNIKTVGFIIMPNVGHAWPTGTGSQGKAGGNWIMQGGLNYPEYIMRWFIDNNRKDTTTK